jgi:SulP family sulfate permease
MSPRTASASLAEPTFIELFTPKLVTVFREGYGWQDLRADAISGLTVAVVALPLSMAIAIASGASPERGLYTAIAGGLIISLIGGSRFRLEDLPAPSSASSPASLKGMAMTVSPSQPSSRG